MTTTDTTPFPAVNPPVPLIPAPSPTPHLSPAGFPPPSTDTEGAERPGRCLPGVPALAVACAAAIAAAVVPLRFGGDPHSLGYVATVLLAALAAFAALGLARGRSGSVWVLTRHGAYRGTVRRTGLLWMNPLLPRRRVDTTVRHWRGSPVEATDAAGTPVLVTVLLVWRVRDTARACFAVEDHVRFLREQTEAAVTRCASRLPADDFRGTGPTLRDVDILAEELTRVLARDLRPAGVEVFSAQPVRVAYAPSVEPAMQRARLAALDARHRRAVLEDVLTAVDDTVRGLTERGLVELDDYERRALVRDLTVAYAK
ncbi:SPFH domain-containing protein [Streptomyces sp. NPDC088354]|uniref:SPFH domain-containing protein n=1 Tax=unclassified Streptomyces TaxID=2593676 RepID=UPI0029A72F9F|nr:SPFH domain-containing protein [Streptomyces sp. MI02-7b]MDX3072327.1 SPFH domain-containing protein [Streptomyces sp. MI02-7b]